MPQLPCLALLVLVMSLFPACTTPDQGGDVSSTYGTLPQGQAAKLYTLTNVNGLTTTLTDFGATLVSLETPDRDGGLADITVGYDTLDGWVNDGSYMGASVGRYGNRIANGKFTLDGTEYTLAQNNGPNHLHGGNVGFNKKLWQAKAFTKDNGSGVAFTYISPAGEEGYPGELTSTVTYFLSDDNELYVVFEATTTAPTVVNLVHHTYWNLTGDPSNTILDHKLMLLADGYVPTDVGGIPNNGIQPVEGTPFDFRSATAIGERINSNDLQLINGKGYDHSWAINGEPGELRTAAVAYDPGSGRIMQIKTDQPAIQFYTGNYMDGSSTGKGGVPHKYRTGFCLETQVFPDSPNQPGLSNAVLRPGETYKHTMVHVFKTKTE
ncbi:MAG: aldose epimerase family protein [Planctomycetota bacterium]